MAKASPGAIVSEIRGKVASTVFQMQKGRIQVSKKRIVLKHQSPGLQRAQQVSAKILSNWRAMSESQRSGWRRLFEKTQQIVPSQLNGCSDAFHYYIFISQMRPIQNQSVITAPPSFSLLPDLGICTAFASESGNSIGFTYTKPVSSAFRIYVFASALIPPGQSYLREKDVRFISRVPNAGGLSVNVRVAYVNRWGSLVGKEGFHFLMAVASTNLDIRQRSSYQFFRGTIGS